MPTGSQLVKHDNKLMERVQEQQKESLLHPNQRIERPSAGGTSSLCCSWKSKQWNMFCNVACCIRQLNDHWHWVGGCVHSDLQEKGENNDTKAAKWMITARKCFCLSRKFSIQFCQRDMSVGYGPRLILMGHPSAKVRKHHHNHLNMWRWLQGVSLM